MRRATGSLRAPGFSTDPVRFFEVTRIRVANRPAATPFLPLDLDRPLPPYQGSVGSANAIRSTGSMPADAGGQATLADWKNHAFNPIFCL